MSTTRKSTSAKRHMHVPNAISERDGIATCPVAVDSSATSHAQILPGDIAWTKAIVETAVDGIIIIDEAGIVEYLNPAAVRLFQYKTEEVLGQNVRMLMPESHARNHDAYIADYVKTGAAKVIGVGREVEGRRKDGSTFPFELSVSEVRVEGRRIFTGIIHDITKRKLAQEEKDRLLRDLNKRNVELMCLYRVEEAIRSTNDFPVVIQEVVTLLQQSTDHPDNVCARIVFDDAAYPNDPPPATDHSIRATIVVGGHVRGTVELHFAEPVEPTLNTAGEPERGIIDAIASILGETVERREAEAKVIQASKLASVGELAAGVGHEINNPVNGILNCAEILIPQFDEGSKYRQFAQLIHSEAERIAKIVHGLLTFSRQEREHHSPARLFDIVEAVLNLSRRRIAKSRIVLEVDVPETLPRIRCRSEQMQQVVMNLLINALHALDEKYPGEHPNKLLQISAAPLEENGTSFIRLTIEDRGTGISPSNMHRLFDPFFTTKGRDKGTGLGLSVSDGIVKDHGGAISVDSEYGAFSRFHVDIPVSQPTTLPEQNM